MATGKISPRKPRLRSHDHGEDIGHQPSEVAHHVLCGKRLESGKEPGFVIRRMKAAVNLLKAMIKQVEDFFEWHSPGFVDV